MKPGDIMIVYSLGAEADRTCDLTFSGEVIFQETGRRVASVCGQTARRPMRRRVRGGQIETKR